MRIILGYVLKRVHGLLIFKSIKGLISILYTKLLGMVTIIFFMLLPVKDNINPNIPEKMESKKINAVEKNIEKNVEKQQLNIETNKRKLIDRVNRGKERELFVATSYDLTIGSCGKSENHPLYGITASGYSLMGKDRESAMTIAVDTDVISLGTRVYVEFIEKEWQHWNGIYTARDTGKAIKGNRIDIFYKDTGGEITEQIVWDFGRQYVKLTILDK